MKKQEVESKLEILRRSKKYARFQGLDYKVTQLAENQYKIFSQEQREGFEPTKRGYAKLVTKTDLDYGYSLNPRASYCNEHYKLLGWSTKENYVVLFSLDKINDTSERYEHKGFSTNIPLSDDKLTLTEVEGDAFDLPRKPSIISLSEAIRDLQNLEGDWQKEYIILKLDKVKKDLEGNGSMPILPSYDQKAMG
ncbi:MAG TPA: hypothetical protein VFV52_02105 [Bacilli bacterium]|nr:hypothetical protein [Bacilli bacterium]